MFSFTQPSTCEEDDGGSKSNLERQLFQNRLASFLSMASWRSFVYVNFFPAFPPYDMQIFFVAFVVD